MALPRGRLVADTSMEDFIDQHSHPRVRVRVGAPARLVVEGAGASRSAPSPPDEGIPVL
ncbi:hypothetical protein ACIP4X_24690 [Streptomyces sp. NPDC088817]|uniref:hypothetical protein n=1 Tax=unclassified Streptomyces TaxID=2593676 RepID=UPI0036E3E7CF